MKTLIAVFVFAALPLLAHSDRLSRIGAFIGGGEQPTGVQGLSPGDKLMYQRQSTQTLSFRARRLDMPGAKENTPKFIELCGTLALDYVERAGKIVPRQKSTLTSIDATVLQRQNATTFLLSKPDYLLITAAPRDWVDGDATGPITAVYDGVADFATVTGAKRSVRRYLEVGSDAISPEIVLLALHNGATFTVRQVDRQRCPICIGKGKIHGDGRRGEDESKLKTCPLGADGLADFTVVFVLQW